MFACALRGGYCVTMKYVGVDGCRAGWISVSIEGDSTVFGMFPTFDALWEEHRDAVRILVDMPIGLPGKNTPKREADTLARRMLGKRASCVFSPGVRELLDCQDYGEACEANRRLIGKKISKQYWNIVPKIKDVDSTLQRVSGGAGVVLESHPEIAFLLASHGEILHGKKTAEGLAERVALLRKYISDFDILYEESLKKWPRKAVAQDDMLDAAILAVAARESSGNMVPMPDPPERDETGLPMAIWYYDFK